MTDQSFLYASGAVRVKVDMSLCIVSGMCTTIVPELFALNSEGQLVLLTDHVSHEMVAALDDAVACCPSEAISVDEPDE